MITYKLFFFHAKFRIVGDSLNSVPVEIFTDASEMIQIESTDSMVCVFNKWLYTNKKELLDENASLLKLSNPQAFVESIYVVNDHADFNESEIKRMLEKLAIQQ